MKHGDGEEVDVLVAEAVGVDGEPVVEEEVAVAHDGAFGPAGGAGGEHDDGEIVGGDGGMEVGWGALGEELLEGGDAGVVKADADDVFEAGRGVEDVGE